MKKPIETHNCSLKCIILEPKSQLFFYFMYFHYGMLFTRSGFKTFWHFGPSAYGRGRTSCLTSSSLFPLSKNGRIITMNEYWPASKVAIYVSSGFINGLFHCSLTDIVLTYGKKWKARHTETNQDQLAVEALCTTTLSVGIHVVLILWQRKYHPS